jgi:hypothetical protein
VLFPLAPNVCDPWATSSLKGLKFIVGQLGQRIDPREQKRLGLAPCRLCGLVKPSSHFLLIGLPSVVKLLCKSFALPAGESPRLRHTRV